MLLFYGVKNWSKGRHRKYFIGECNSNSWCHLPCTEISITCCQGCPEFPKGELLSLSLVSIYKVVKILTTCLGTCILSCPVMVWSPFRCSDQKCWSFTRNICNRFIESFKVFFEALSQACSALVMTIWRPGFTPLTANSAVRRALVVLAFAGRLVHFLSY